MFRYPPFQLCYLLVFPVVKRRSRNFGTYVIKQWIFKYFQ